MGAEKQLGPSLKALLGQQVRGAVTSLDDSQLSLAHRIHGARKHLKKARSALRLLRPIIGEDRFQEENASLRNIARSMSPARDAQVMLETIKQLIKKDLEKHPRRRYQNTMQEMKGLVDSKLSALQRQTETIEGAKRVLAGIQKRLDTLPVPADPTQALKHGLRNGYRKAKKRAKKALKKEKNVALHEWRKETQRLRYQLELLETLKLSSAKGVIPPYRDLSDRLGKLHDLAVLKQTIHQLVLPKHERAHLLKRIRNEKKKTFSKLSPLKDRVYASSTKSFLKRTELH